MHKITFDEYQSLAGETDEQHPIDYYFAGVASEVGELCAVRKRQLRGDADPGDILAEVGDVLWYLARILAHYLLPFSHAAEGNITKLRSRKKRGVIRGHGDNR